MTPSGTPVATRGVHDVAATLHPMTLHAQGYEVGVRALHDRLSEHLEAVEGGAEVLVTRRGQPIARLSAVNDTDPLAELVRRGLVTPPDRLRAARKAAVKPRGSVSELVAEQRR
jgi:prevent-host-death family protein